MKSPIPFKSTLFPALLLFAAAQATQAAAIDPFYSSVYSFVDLGSAPGVTPSYGGIVVSSGDSGNILLGGGANTASAEIDRVGVTRGAGNHINGFTGTTSKLADANGGGSGGIDGGLVIAPNGALLYTSYSDNYLGELKPGSTTPDKLVALSPLGVSSSVGSLAISPYGGGGAIHVKIASYNSNNWYDAILTPDGSGTYDVTNVTLKTTLQGGVEGIFYVPAGSNLFTNPSILVAEYGNGVISSYEVDANGDPLVGTRKIFMSGLTGAEGAALDPFTNDFLFSTFGGGNHVIAVQGFAAPSVPLPATVWLFGLGLSLLAGYSKRRETK